MTPDLFISTWRNSGLNERQGAQMHFANLCDLLGVPKPTGTSLMDQGYGFEIKATRVRMEGSFGRFRIEIRRRTLRAPRAFERPNVGST